MSTIIQLRRGTAALWTSTDPILAQGEKGLETDTGLTKTGDGLSLWSVLPYDASGGGSALTVSDEGTPLSTAVTLINFAGAGVTVTEPVPDQVLVTIPTPAVPIASVGDTATVDLVLTGTVLTANVQANSIGSAQLDPTTDAALALAHAAATVGDTATVNLTLAGQHITADVQPNSIGAAELDPTVDAALALAHPAVTVTDSATIDFTLTGQDITAIVKADSIGTTELAPAVEAMLAGYVVGPASAVVDEIARFDNVSGKLLKAGLKYQTGSFAPIDVTAGALLAQFAYGLGRTYEAAPGGDFDFNLLDFTGFTSTINATTFTNAPTFITAFIPGLVLTVVDAVGGSTTIWQLCISTTGTPAIGYRMKTALGVWSSWYESAIAGTTIDTGDLNTSNLKSGFYAVAASTANAPETGAGHVIVNRAGTTPVVVSQLFIVGNTGASTSPSPMYLRTRNGATGTWTPWHKQYDSVGQNVNTSTTGQMGFATGAGGTNTQGTSKATAVTMASPRPVGNIITFNDNLNAGADVAFTFNNSLIAANDTLHVCVAGPSRDYVAEATYIRAGACDIVLRNRTVGNLAQAVTINYVIIKGAIS